MRSALLCFAGVASMVAGAQTAAPAPGTPPVAPPALLHGVQPSGEGCKYSGSHTVLINVTVTAEGTPVDEGVATSSGNACLDVQAVKAVAQYRFRPAMRAGQPVATQLRISVNFRKFKE